MKEKTERLLPWLIITVIFIHPFFSGKIQPETNFYFALILLFIFLIFLHSKEAISVPNKGAIFLVLILFLILFVSTAFSIYPNNSLRESFSYLSYLLIFILIIFSLTKNDTEKVLFAIIASSGIIALYGIYQYFIGFELTLQYVQKNPEKIRSLNYVLATLKEKRVFSTTFSPDMLAGYLIMIIPAAFAALVSVISDREIIKNEELKRRVAIYLLSTLLIFFALILTRSIGAWLSLIIILMPFSYFMIKNIQDKRLRKIFLVGMAFLISLSLIFLSFVIIKRSKDRNLPNYFPLSVKQRTENWDSSVNIIKDFPVTGVGIGNFGIIYPKYKLPDANETKYAHNNYLQLAAEAGLLGLLILLWIIFELYKISYKYLKQNRDYISLGLLASASAFLIHSLIDFDFFIPEVAFHWWVITGLLTVRTGVIPKAVRFSKLVKIFLLFLVLISSFFAGKFILSDSLFEIGIEKQSENKDAAEVDNYLRKAIKLDPKNDLYYTAMSKNLERQLYENQKRTELIPEIIGYYKKAIALNPYYSYHHRDLGLFYMRLGLPQMASEEFKKAIEMYPTNQVYPVLLQDATKAKEGMPSK